MNEFSLYFVIRRLVMEVIYDEGRDQGLTLPHILNMELLAHSEQLNMESLTYREQLNLEPLTYFERLMFL